MTKPDITPIQIAPAIYHCLYRPNHVDDNTTGAGAFEHTHGVPAAPWLPHATTRTVAPGHIAGLAAQLIASQSPLSVTDGTTTITMQPTLMGLAVSTTTDGSLIAFAHVGWAQNPTTGPFLHSVRLDVALSPAFIQAHQAYLQATQAAIPVSL